MRLIDADGSELQTQLKIIREAEYQIYGSGSWGFTAKCEHAIEDAPTVQPEPHWIPVTERLPEKTGRYLAWAVVSFIPDHVDEPNTIKQIAIASYSTRTRTWFGGNVEDVIAWMPLPEQFNGVAK